jgi:hypothetical protein
MDDLQLKVSADFSELQEQFKNFSSTINKNSNMEGLQAEITSVTQSFEKLISMSKDLDTVLSTPKGIRDFKSALIQTANDSKNLRASVKGSDMDKAEATAINTSARGIERMLDPLKAQLNSMLTDLRAQEKLASVQAKSSAQSTQANTTLNDIKNAKTTGNNADKKGMLYASTEQLNTELQLLTKEEGIVGNLVKNFQTLVKIIETKNKLLGTENQLIQQEVNTTSALDNKTEAVNVTTPKSTSGHTMVHGNNTGMSNDEFLRDKNLQEESTIRYNMRKQAEKEELQTLNDIYKIQDKINRLEKENLTAGKDTVNNNKGRINNLQAQEQQLINSISPENQAKANANKEQLNANLTATANDKESVQNLKNQNVEYEKTKKLVNELIDLETRLAKVKGTAEETTLSNRLNDKRQDYYKQKVNLDMNQRSEIDDYYRDMKFKPELATAQAQDTAQAQSEKEANAQLELEKRNLQDIDNMIAKVNTKMEQMKENYGTFLETSAIKSKVDDFVQKLEQAKTKPADYNKSTSGAEFNKLVNSINTSAKEEGLSNPTTMYNKLLALIKEESNLRLKTYKINDEDNGEMAKKLQLTQQQIAELEQILSQYNLLTNAQKESLDIEKQKAEATYQSGKNVLANKQSTVSDKTNATTNSAQRFFDVYKNESPGLISSLTSVESKIFGLKFAFESLVSIFGGHQLYNWLIENNAQIETLQKSMEVVMHSTQKAAKTIQDLRSYAALTPFQENETFQAGESLAANRMNVGTWIRTAGDLAAAKKPQGIELNDVVNVITRINSGDFGKAMIRLRQMGISLNDFRAEGLKFSKNNTFLGNTDQMLNALQRIVQQRYGGMTEVLGNTVEGSLSTIKDYFKQIGIDLGAETFNDFRNSLQKWKRELQTFRDSPEFKQIISNFNNAYKTLKPFVSVIGGELLSGLKLVANFLPEIATGLKMFTMIKLFQGGFKIFDTLVNNWKLVNGQLTTQNTLLEQGNGVQVTGNGILGRTYDALAKIVAMRKLGLQYADETAAADAVANGNITARGVNFAKNTYANGKQNPNFVGPMPANTKVAEDALAKNGASVASAGIGMAIVSKLNIALMLLPLVGMITGALRQAFNSKADSKYSSDDYDRMASEDITNANRLGSLNIQRQTAKAQIDYYTVNAERFKKQEADAFEKAKANPQDSEAARQYDDAVKQNAEATHNLTASQEQLYQANKQIIDVAPELTNQLMDSQGNLTDSAKENADAFKRNTDAIEENIRSRAQEIAEKKRQQIETAGYEAAKAQRQIDQNNSDSKMAEQLRSSLGSGGSKAGYFFTSMLDSAAGMFGGSDTIAEWKRNYAIAAQDDEDRKISESGLKADNYTQQSTIGKKNDLQRDWDEAISKGFTITGQDGSIMPDYTRWEPYKEKHQQTTDDYLKSMDGVATKASDIESNGDTKLDQLKTIYQAKLNQIKKKHGGKSDSQEYKDMEKARDEAVESAGNEVIKELTDIQKSNDAMKAEAILKAKGTQIEALAGIMEKDSGVTVQDLMDALTQLKENGNTLVTGKLQQYQEALQTVYKELDLGENFSNIEKYTAQLDEFEQSNNNAQTIQAEIDKYMLKLTQTEKDSGSGKTELQLYNEKWEDKVREAQDNKEIALQSQKLQGNLEDSQVYKDSTKENDKKLQEIILEDIKGLNDFLSSGNLTEEETADTKKRIADLTKQSQQLSLEIADKKNTEMEEFHRKWDNQNEIIKAKNELALQRDELNNFGADSSQYQADFKNQGLAFRDRLLAEARDLQARIPKLNTDEQLSAQLQLLQLNKEANQILLDIKKNTSDVGEFNKPSFVKAMTYYDYMTRSSDMKGIEIANAQFAFKIDQVQSQEDVNNMMATIQSALGNHISQSDKLGVTNPHVFG